MAWLIYVVMFSLILFHFIPCLINQYEKYMISGKHLQYASLYNIQMT